MKITNKLGLPSSIVSAVENDSYSAGNADISVTRLIAPPYQVRLLKGNVGRIVEDASDRIYALMGQIGHSIIERATIDPVTSIAEQRIFMPATFVGVDKPGYIVSGAFDLVEKNTVFDFKYCSVWAASGKIEWEQQLNMLRVLCQYQLEQTGDQRFLINEARIVAIYRDWMKAKAGFDNHPKHQVESLHIPIWPLEQAKEFMAQRIRLHTTPNPPVCTDDERWKTEQVWALMKSGRKAAVKLYKSAEEANAKCAVAGKGHTVVERPVTYKRCESYCSAASFCPAWSELKAAAPF